MRLGDGGMGRVGGRSWGEVCWHIDKICYLLEV